MTPNDIEVLIHCHVSPEPHPRIQAFAVQEALRMMEGRNLVERVEDNAYVHPVYRTTERGRAHLIQLCALPFPTCEWVNARGERIEVNQP